MIAGLVLAAGEGKRFGPRSKLLAPLGGRPVLEHAVRAQCAVPALERIVVVLGAHADELVANVDFGRASPVVCDWRPGRASSLRFGLAELAGADRVLVTLGDQPLISPEAIVRLAGESPGTRAVYDGIPGHPVVLGPEQMAALSDLTGDRGAAELIAGGRTVECGDLGSSWDIDTPEDLEAVRALLSDPAAPRT